MLTKTKALLPDHTEKVVRAIATAATRKPAKAPKRTVEAQLLEKLTAEIAYARALERDIRWHQRTLKHLDGAETKARFDQLIYRALEKAKARSKKTSAMKGV